MKCPALFLLGGTGLFNTQFGRTVFCFFFPFHGKNIICGNHISCGYVPKHIQHLPNNLQECAITIEMRNNKGYQPLQGTGGFKRRQQGQDWEYWRMFTARIGWCGQQQSRSLSQGCSVNVTASFCGWRMLSGL